MSYTIYVTANAREFYITSCPTFTEAYDKAKKILAEHTIFGVDIRRE